MCKNFGKHQSLGTKAHIFHPLRIQEKQRLYIQLRFCKFPSYLLLSTICPSEILYLKLFQKGIYLPPTTAVGNHKLATTSHLQINKWIVTNKKQVCHSLPTFLYRTDARIEL